MTGTPPKCKQSRGCGVFGWVLILTKKRRWFIILSVIDLTNKDKVPILCAPEPCHYCRVDRDGFDQKLKRIAACELVGDNGGAMKAYIGLGNLLIGGCPSVRGYCRRSLENQDLALALEMELIGLRMVAQHLSGVKPMFGLGMNPDIIWGMIYAAEYNYRHGNRNGVINQCVGIGEHCIGVKPELGGNIIKITPEDIAEEIGLQVFIISITNCCFMPDPDICLSLCGGRYCPLVINRAEW